MLVRPPFQFVDEQLESIEEGDQLEYHIAAHATDRILAQSRIVIPRHTVQPIDPPSRTLALHHPAAKTDASNRKDELEFLVSVPASTVAEELRVAFRCVPIPTSGSYGTDRDLAFGTVWKKGLGDNTVVNNTAEGDKVLVRFAESEASRPVGWTEVEHMADVQGINLNWNLEEITEGDEEIIAARNFPGHHRSRQNLRRSDRE